MDKTTLRILLSIGNSRDANLCQADVTQAFLWADLDEEVYVTAPPGYRADYLRIITYGIARSGREWRPLVAPVTSSAPEYINAAWFSAACLTRSMFDLNERRSRICLGLRKVRRQFHVKKTS